MYQNFVSHEERGPTARDKVTHTGVYISESENGLTIQIDQEVKTSRSGGNLRTEQKDELRLNSVPTEELAELKNLLESWIDSQSHPSSNISIENISGEYIEEPIKSEMRGTIRHAKQVDFSCVDIYVGTAGVGFHFLADDEEIQFQIPASEYVKRGSPEDYNNILELNGTIHDYFVIEYEGEVAGFDIPPTMDNEERLDEELSRRAVSEFEAGHFQSSVRTAFTVLEERIRQYGNYPNTDYGVNLIQDALHPDNGELSFGESRGEKDGVMFLYRGAYQALRNPASHRFVAEVDEDYARDALHTVNLLLRLLDANQTE